jgi:peptidoglycan hydrolase-like protein with peptidoglycan-binding domain
MLNTLPGVNQQMFISQFQSVAPSFSNVSASQPTPTSTVQAAPSTTQMSSVQPPNANLNAGSMNTAAVKQLQDYLVSQGLMTQSQVNTGYGTYGPQTTAAVTALQQRLVSQGKMTQAQVNTGVGIFGPQTYAAISAPTQTIPQATPTTTIPTTTPAAPSTTPTTTPTAVTSPAQTQPNAPATYSGFKDTSTSLKAPTTSLSPGSSGENVAALQKWLIAQGYDIPAISSGTATYGYFGDQTKNALAAFQKAAGINTNGNDGYYGPLTIAKIGSVMSQATTATANQTPANTDQTVAIGQNMPKGVYDSGSIDLSNPGAIFANGGTGVYLMRVKEYPNQVYYLDAKSNLAHPFDQGAFDEYFGGSQEAAMAAVQDVPLKEFTASGSLSKVTLLTAPYGVNGQGKHPIYNEPTAGSISQTYGQPKVSQDQLKSTWTLVDSMLGYFKNNDQKQIDKTFLNGIINNQAMMTSYLNAAQYGGYTMNDILRDIKRRELISKGRTDLNNVVPISLTQTKKDFQSSPQFQSAAANSDIALFNTGTKELDTTIMNLPIFQIDPKLYSTLTPTLVKDSPEWKAAMDKIEASAYDLAIQQTTAATESEKAQADDAYKKLQDGVMRKYGIALENSALDAWKQVQGLKTQEAARGLNSNSGLVNEDIDYYLRQVRRNDQINRVDRVTTVEGNENSQLTKYGTPAEVQRSIQEDQAKGLPREQWRAVRWGLVPSAEVAASYDLASMKARFPNTPEADLIAARNTVLDENGNYRSDLFAKKAANIQANTTAAQAYKEGKLLDNSVADADKAYKEFSASAPFSDVNTPVAPSVSISSTPGTQPAGYSTNSNKDTSQTQSASSGTPAGAAPAGETVKQMLEKEKQKITPAADPLEKQKEEIKVPAGLSNFNPSSNKVPSPIPGYTPIQAAPIKINTSGQNTGLSAFTQSTLGPVKPTTGGTTQSLFQGIKSFFGY